jgi:hypothetical protein
VDLGKKILAESGLAVIPADTMADAAEKIVAAVEKPCRPMTAYLAVDKPIKVTDWPWPFRVMLV